ncbi:hypothetical protein L798_00525 [Zootermopsis nevadensis]|uniref:Uncharacterized protein n=1 Tax=Zootermopsis nevadensis TaxID=136037 RepID=A0A067QKV2_ZOONE|nr:hypothetical protein L798_00525 [Zootermopsis nevadensis]
MTIILYVNKRSVTGYSPLLTSVYYIRRPQRNVRYRRYRNGFLSSSRCSVKRIQQVYNVERKTDSLSDVCPEAAHSICFRVTQRPRALKNCGGNLSRHMQGRGVDRKP